MTTEEFAIICMLAKEGSKPDIEKLVKHCIDLRSNIIVANEQFQRLVSEDFETVGNG